MNERKYKILHNIFFSAFGVFLVILTVRAAHNSVPPLTLSSSTSDVVRIELNGVSILADVAHTKAQLLQGLSGKDKLLENHGMWFVFGYSDRWGIWMKDMNFPIDIVWFDENSEIVDIKINVSPETYPEVFYPLKESSFVLELSSGAVEKYHLEVGNRVYLR